MCSRDLGDICIETFRIKILTAPGGYNTWLGYWYFQTESAVNKKMVADGSSKDIAVPY